ncbi:MAG: putative phage tail assembly chaperone [Pseudodesulfovibrio sp.]|uniref:Phage protein n=1 Tax=Pseudodesulfovibrio aespoeensis (strain ATCC 700646 / DSM 10631 / Aspo-2) TaxID=643562 RepID=E6VXM3_PSEA9|nr:MULTISPECIES: putative phage tail assembly chaperone [Pseudodesulfovibrio]MBU4192888.1 putative phage tail assembly chaperone [Pseudomonadota bacterium]ADU61481.1 phage protein [Pseudodesulfovibrio aespoeensis Aspo-2]MBU4244515.1 putative phage tail assembly chaperone [Pseudomonadota bacterium]MBU4379851.1 putative phage tail assembly chaperone [Pseudomonadota bacterium]MBU4476525.1 putative phage tail assembly chaperone [Pseudomonadota bacterium]
MNRNITLDINSREIEFNVNPDAYNKFINEFQPTSKVAPSHAFLMRTVTEASKPALRELLAMPGAAVEIVGALVEEYKPNLIITVGKSSSSPSE